MPQSWPAAHASPATRAATSPARRLLRLAMVAVAALLAAAMVVFVPLAGWALLSPFEGVPVPVACAAGEAGTVIAAAGSTVVAVVAGSGGRTASGTAQVLADGRPVFSVPIASRVVAAGIDSGRVYLFDDKIGYFLDAATGAPLADLFTVDNYRGLYVDRGREHVQTTFRVAFVGLPGHPFLARDLPFGVIVDGCLVTAPG